MGYPSGMGEAYIRGALGNQGGLGPHLGKQGGEGRGRLGREGATGLGWRQAFGGETENTEARVSSEAIRRTP